MSGRWQKSRDRHQVGLKGAQRRDARQAGRGEMLGRRQSKEKIPGKQRHWRGKKGAKQRQSMQVQRKKRWLAGVGRRRDPEKVAEKDAGQAGGGRGERRQRGAQRRDARKAGGGQRRDLN